MKPQEAAWLLVLPGGNSAIKTQAMRKQTCGCNVSTVFESSKEMKMSYHVDKVAGNQWTSSSKLVDEQNTACLSKQGNDVVDGLVFESIGLADTNLSINRRRIILNCRDSGHLDRSLKSAGNEESAERRSVGEELDVRLGFVLMFEGNRFLNLIVLGSDPWIVDIAVGVEPGKSLETFVWAVVVNEPAMRIKLVLVLNHCRLMRTEHTEDFRGI